MIATGTCLAYLGVAPLAAAPARAESSIVHFEATMADGGSLELPRAW